jgi:hypothetical protein
MMAEASFWMQLYHKYSSSSIDSNDDNIEWVLIYVSDKQMMV